MPVSHVVSRVLPSTEQKREIVKPPPMMWAQHAQTGLAVHVDELPRSQTGRACNCVCPSCREELQAVNAGRDPSYFSEAGSIGKFFRHPHGHPRNACMQAAAQLAAFHLLFQQGVIDVPAPRRKRFVHGVSGHPYEGLQIGARQRLAVRSRAWVGSHGATLTLEDGHVVLLALESNFESHLSGAYDGVITVQVDDPRVAAMSPEEILSRMKLTETELCWRKHWDDPVLDEQAQAKAEQMARQAIDYLTPEELAWLAGVGSLGTESVLHLAIKKIIADAGVISAPVYLEVHEEPLSNGRKLSTRSKLDLGLLSLTQVRLEHWMQDMVPDLFCHARHRTGGFDLMIEVVVSNPVSPEKLKKIQERGIPCIELDIAQFHQHGLMTLDRLRVEVLDNPDSKSWLYHPEIQAKREHALEQLRREVAEAETQIAAARKHELEERGRIQRETLERQALGLARRNAFLQSLYDTPTARLPEFFLQCVREYAHDRKDGAKHIDFDAVAEVLTGAGWKGTEDHWLWTRYGVLDSLDFIREAASRQSISASAHVLDRLGRTLSSPGIRAYAVLQVMAISAYQPKLDASQRKALADLRKRIADSLKDGKFEFARPIKHNAIVARLFPELANSLRSDYGTVQTVTRKIEELTKEQRKRDEDMRQRTAASAVRDAIKKAQRLQWARPVGFARDTDQAMSLGEVKAVAKQLALHDIDAWRALELAFETRARNEPVFRWIESVGPATEETVQLLVQLLRASWSV